MNSTNTVVANAMAARNAAPKGLTPTTKLRLKEDFSDEYGSYRKGDVFPMYAMGGINPRFGTMMVPGRGVTLQIPWENLEVVNAKRVKNSKASGMVAKELNRLTAEARSIYNDIDRKVNEIKKATAQVSALRLQVDPLVKKILDIEKDGELTIRALDENDPDRKEADAAYQSFLHEMWNIKREIQ